MNKFTSGEVQGLKKRLKALRDAVRADKHKSNNAALLDVTSCCCCHDQPTESRLPPRTITMSLVTQLRIIDDGIRC